MFHQNKKTKSEKLISRNTYFIKTNFQECLHWIARNKLHIWWVTPIFRSKAITLPYTPPASFINWKKLYFVFFSGYKLVFYHHRWKQPVTTESIDQYGPHGNVKRGGKCQMICHPWSSTQAQEIPWIPVEIEIQELRGFIFWQ